MYKKIMLPIKFLYHLIGSPVYGKYGKWYRYLKPKRLTLEIHVPVYKWLWWVLHWAIEKEYTVRQFTQKLELFQRREFLEEWRKWYVHHYESHIIDHRLKYDQSLLNKLLKKSIKRSNKNEKA